MAIIAQTDTISKSETCEEFLALDTHQATSGDGYKRTLAYKEWRNRAAAAMFEAGQADEALAFLTCAEIPSQVVPSNIAKLPANAATVWVCDHDANHKAHVFYPCCDSRGCPDCAHRQVARFARRYVPAILAAVKKRGRNRLRKLVLTTPLDLRDPDSHQKVRDYCKALGKIWKLLEKRNPQWQTLGTLEAFEFGPNGHKLHFHVFHYGTYLPKNELSKAWQTVTGGEAFIVDVQSVAQDDNATDDDIANEVLETLKYSVKFWSRSAQGDVSYIDPVLMPHLVRAIKGTRRVRSRGIFYNIPDVPRQPLCCGSCGEEMLRVGVAFFPTWQATGYSPKEYQAMLDGDRLDLILANKLVSKGEELNKSPPSQEPLWTESGEDWYPGHAFYENDNRKVH